MANALHIPNERLASDAAWIARGSYRVGYWRGKGAVAVIQINVEIGAGVVAHHQVSAPVSIQVAGCDGESGGCGTVHSRRLEGAVAVAHQDLKLAAAATHADRQIQFAVAVQVCRH